MITSVMFAASNDISFGYRWYCLSTSQSFMYLDMMSTNSVIFVHSFNFPWIAFNIWLDAINARSYVYWQIFTTVVKVNNVVTYVPRFSVLIFRCAESLFCTLTSIHTQTFPIVVHFNGPRIHMEKTFLFALVRWSNSRLNCFVDVFFFYDVVLTSFCT